MLLKARPFSSQTLNKAQFDDPLGFRHPFRMKKFFFLHSFFLLLGTLSPTHNAFALYSLPSKTKEETELKVNLTKKGFENLRKRFLEDFKGKESQRKDYYFDIFEDSQYLLKKTSPAIKLRFMWDGLDLKWQTQKVEQAWVGSFFSFKKTLALTVDLSEEANLLNEISRYHEKLVSLDSSALRDAEVIENAIGDLGLIKASKTLCALCFLAPERTRFFSTHINTKKRVKIKIKNKEEAYTLQVGQTLNQDQSSFELEAEIENSPDLNKSALYIENWLISKAHFKAASDIDPSLSKDPTLFSEKRLIYLHSL